jgi:hypothetical protein
MTHDELWRRGWNEKAGSWWYGEGREPHPEGSEALAEAVERMIDDRLMEFWDWAMTEVANGRHAGHGDPVEAFYASREVRRW